jgi:hypothetical protein
MILIEKYVLLSSLCTEEINIIGERKRDFSNLKHLVKVLKSKQSHVEKASIIFQTKRARAFQSN